MIPLSTFNMMVVVAFLMVIYSIIDHDNRLYANVITTFMSGLLFTYLAVSLTTNIIYEVIAGVVTPINSPSLGYFLYFMSIIMFGYTMIMTYEIIDEAYAEKQALMVQSAEEGQ